MSLCVASTRRARSPSTTLVQENQKITICIPNPSYSCATAKKKASDLITIGTISPRQLDATTSPDNKTHFKSEITLSPLTPTVLPIEVVIPSLFVITCNGLRVVRSLEPS